MNVILVNFILSGTEGIIKENLTENILKAAYYGDLDGLRRSVQECPEAVTFFDDFTGASALHYSAGLGNYSCVEFLLACPKIDVGQKDFEGNTALDYALRVGHNKVFEILADRVFPNRNIGTKLGL